MVPCIKSISEHKENIEKILEHNIFEKLKLHDREGLFMPIYKDSEICPNVRSVEVVNESGGVYIATIRFDETEEIQSIVSSVINWTRISRISECRP